MGRGLTEDIDRMDEYTSMVSEGWRRLFPELDLAPFDTGIRALRLGRLVEKAMDTAATERGLVVGGDYEVLGALRRAHPEPLQPAALAQRTMITTSGMTGRLDRLESEGLVERRQNPSDRRAVDIHITPKGRRTADEIFQGIVAAVSDMFGSLDPAELATLSAALRSSLVSLGDTLSPSD